MPTAPELTAVTLTDSLLRKYPLARCVHPPMLAGTVIADFVRCGKPGCRCRRGERHGPYFYHTFREGGRLRRLYVPRSELLAVLAMCENRRTMQAMCLENRREHATLIRGANAMLRGLERERAQRRAAR